MKFGGPPRRLFPAPPSTLEAALIIQKIIVGTMPSAVSSASVLPLFLLPPSMNCFRRCSCCHCDLDPPLSSAITQGFRSCSCLGNDTFPLLLLDRSRPSIPTAVSWIDTDSVTPHPPKTPKKARQCLYLPSAATAEGRTRATPSRTDYRPEKSMTPGSLAAAAPMPMMQMKTTRATSFRAHSSCLRCYHHPRFWNRHKSSLSPFGAFFVLRLISLFITPSPLSSDLSQFERQAPPSPLQSILAQE